MAAPGLEDYGGAARFVAVVSDLRRAAEHDGCRTLPGGDGDIPRAVILLSSGDNFLPGPTFSASLAKGVPFHESRLVDLSDFTALTLGNHEFDFGPDVLADFITGTAADIPFLSANLDFTAEPRLQELADQGHLRGSLLIERAGRKIGIIGATTEHLPFISSPRKVRAGSVEDAVTREVSALRAGGAEIILLSSHLQGIAAELDLVARVEGLDAVIAGGGDELLINPDDLLVPGHEQLKPFGPYPLDAAAPEGTVPLVTTPGHLLYIGRLELLFDVSGAVIAAGGGLERVDRSAGEDERTRQEITLPLERELSGLAQEQIARSEVALDGRRHPGVRTQETNLGNLLADAMLVRGRHLAHTFGKPPPDIAVVNGGGIRNGSIIPPGPISALDSFTIAPFANFVTIVSPVTPTQLKEIMEHALALAPRAAGSFAQIAGFSVRYDPAGQAQRLDLADGRIVSPGARVRDLVLDDGRIVVRDGVLAENAPSALVVATNDFLARGGDLYPFGRLPPETKTGLGITYQQALSSYLQDDLAGLVGAAAYPEIPPGGGLRIRETVE